jgi:hypothetical protein
MENQNVQKESDVLIFAATNENVIKAVEAISNQENVELVRLEDKVLTDYLKSKSKQETKPITVDEFVADAENRKTAEEKAMYLWNLLTNNATTDKAFNRIFTKSEIVQRTTLTNKTLGELLDLLSLFGLITFTKGTYEFKFLFGEKLQQAETYADIIQDITLMNVNIVRYKNLFKDDAEREAAVKELQENIAKLIQY